MGDRGGGRFSPNTPASSPNFCQLSLTKSYNVLAKNLFAISQLHSECLRRLKFPNIRVGHAPRPPYRTAAYACKPTIAFNIFPPPPQTKILDRTLALYYRWANIIFSRFPVPAMHGNMTFPSLYILEMPQY